MKQHPPKWAARFLRFYCKEQFLEEIEGDVYELFEARLDTDGKSVARRLFIWDVLRFFRWSNIKKSKRFKSNSITMTLNNFKIAARVLSRQKVNSALNVLGISIGIACFVLIALYVRQELGFDQFHDKKDQIYRAWVKEVYEDERVFFNTVTPLPLGPRLQESIPEVEDIVQLDGIQTLVGRGEGRTPEEFQLVTPNFFDVFDFEILEGNRENPLPDRNAIVLSEDYAIKYFGNTSPIGESITLEIQDSPRDFIVTAIAENAPLTTGVSYTMLVSFDNKDVIYSERAMNAWFNISPETYVVLKEGVDPASLEAKTKAMVKTILNEGAFGGAPVEDHYLIGFQNITDIHLDADIPVGRYPVGNPDYVYILGAIGLLVLVIACVNYTTLSIGQSLKRAKEVGLRKVVGAANNSLVWQYLTESILVALISTIVGAGLTLLALPVFNELAMTQLSFSLTLTNLIALLILSVLIGLLSGIYPALILVKLRVISILRGASQGAKGKQTARKGMLVFQFLITVLLISSTLIMRKQLSYLQNQDLGYNYDAMVSVPLYPESSANGLRAQITSAMENGEKLKAELSKNPQLDDFAMGSHVFGSSGWVSLGFNSNRGDYLQFNLLVVDPYYMQAFGIEMLQGRDFDANLEIDKTQSVIINKAAADYFGFENPIGAKLPGDEFGDHQIVGVSSDFNFSSLHQQVTPLVIVQNPAPIFQGINDFNGRDSPIPKLVFRFKGTNLTQVPDILAPVWDGIFPSQELNFNFVEQRLENQYQSEARVNKIIGIATVLSITIASFGLLALTILIVNAKIKEIGIRKVLGASPTAIFRILLRSFIFQLVIAVAVSVPLTWYFMDQWLEDFAYRINIGADMFLLSSLIALTLMLTVISYHAIRASRVNPVKALRTE